MRVGPVIASVIVALAAASGASAQDTEGRIQPEPTPKAAAPASTSAIARTTRAARPKNMPAGAVAYDKPVMRNGRLVLWHGGWRGKGKERAADARSADGKSAEPAAARRGAVRAVEKPAATAALAGTAAAGLATDKAADAPKAPGKAVKLALSIDAPDQKALAEVAAAVAPVAALDQAEGRADADVALIYAPLAADAGASAQAVARLYDAHVHIVTIGPARTVADLADKRVEIGPAGSQGALTAQRLFRDLGVAARLVEGPREEAMRKLGRGEADAVVVIGPRGGLAGAPKGASFVAIPFAPAIRQAFLPAELTKADYPALVGGQPVDTLAVPTLLVARNAGDDPARRERLTAFADAFLTAVDGLAAGGSPRWRDVNLAAKTTLPRFAPAQAWMDKSAAN
ncbi:MAG: hypothetical protein IPL88_13060 [Rhizobiales bacterium]|nr:hypothetical protein [Hyphomicrobiales bacterium]